MRDIHSMFINDIDNSIAVKNVDNYFIGAIFDNDSVPNGVIQMFNFKHGVKKIHIKRFEAMRGFLGGCLQNIEDVTRNMNTLVGIQMNLKDCVDKARLAADQADQNLEDIRQINMP